MTVGKEDEANLVKLAKLGSSRAFRILMQHNQHPVRLFLRRMVVSADVAEDLAQDTFATAWARLSSYRGEARFRTWLCSIAYRKALMAKRSSGREQARILEAHIPPLGMAPPHLKMDLERGLQTLPPERRAAVVLCLANGLTHEEAADALCIPLGTVKSHVLRGRQALQDWLRGSDYND